MLAWELELEDPFASVALALDVLLFPRCREKEGWLNLGELKPLSTIVAYDSISSWFFIQMLIL